MNKIPLKEAIDASAWLECHWKTYDEEFNCRLRIVTFTTFDKVGIDTSLLKAIGDNGVLWLMTLEVVNLCKTPFEAWQLSDCMKLLDEDGFEFGYFDNGDLTSQERKGKSGLYRFSGWSDNPPLSPKIKTVGGIPFLLPDQESNYYLTIEDGTIKEA